MLAFVLDLSTTLGIGLGLAGLGATLQAIRSWPARAYKANWEAAKDRVEELSLEVGELKSDLKQAEHRIGELESENAALKVATDLRGVFEQNQALQREMNEHFGSLIELVRNMSLGVGAQITKAVRESEDRIVDELHAAIGNAQAPGEEGVQ